jgi:two-component system response regulator YesN
MGILEYMDDNVCSQSLSAEMLADMVSLTPHYFGKVFKKVTNISYSEYLTKLRIGKAKEMLIGTDLKINEIGEKCGFTSNSYFVTIFKKSEGKTPNTYRSENINLNN